MDTIPKVAIIGRANVGKSTLFNTLSEQKRAIVSNIAGTTRDRNYAAVSWKNLDFQLIDTGGIDIVHPQDIESDILKQAQFAKTEADLILFLVNCRNGLMPQDKNIALLLKKCGKPIILTINKADSPQQKENLSDFYKLNVGKPWPISALNGTGTGDLLDEVVAKLNWKTHRQTTTDKQPPTNNIIKIAIIGKPNVGKSTLINAILGEERMITSPLPYTTRGSQDINFTYQNQKFTLIDTAGIRKHAKIKNKLEKLSVKQALQSLNQADVALLMTDAAEPLGQQDKTLSDEILQSKTSLIIIANKWDKINSKDSVTINKFTRYYYQFFPYLKFAPVMFVSALEKQRVHKILELAVTVYSERFREISHNALDKFLNKIQKKQLPARGKDTSYPKIFQLKQLGVNPPVFEIVEDCKSDLHESYIRFIENQLREKFGFLGTPVIIKVRRLKS